MTDLRTPTGKDIAKLFELCAPEPLLENLGIDEYDDEPYFIDIFDLMDEFLQIKVTAMALFFSNRTLANYEKTKSIVKNLYISPEIIHSLIEFTGVEGYKEIEAIFSSIRNEEMRHPSKIKHEITKNKWSPIIADFYKMMSQKPNGLVTETRRYAAEKHGIKNASDKTLSRHMPYPQNRLDKL